MQDSRGRHKFSSLKSDVICRSADVMGCAPVFCGTRVPVQALLDYLAVGDTIDEFLVGFPAVTHDQVVELLKLAKDKLVETVS